MTPYVGSHDTSRFLTLTSDPGRSGNKWTDLPTAPTTSDAYDRMYLALAWLLSIPGAPLLYYGDEYGQWGGADPNNNQSQAFFAGKSAGRGYGLGRGQRQLGREGTQRAGKQQERLPTSASTISLRDSSGGRPPRTLHAPSEHHGARFSLERFSKRAGLVFVDPHAANRERTARLWIDIDHGAGVVTIGDEADLLVAGELVGELVWTDGPVTGEVLVQCSAHGTPHRAVLDAGGAVRWAEPQRRISPGQSAVFYDLDDDRVLGGGVVVTGTR